MLDASEKAALAQRAVDVSGWATVPGRKAARWRPLLGRAAWTPERRAAQSKRMRLRSKVSP